MTWVHRVLRNSTLEDWEAAGCPPTGRRPGEGETLASDSAGHQFLRYDDAPPRAGMSGDLEAMCLYAGTSCDSIEDIPPVGELMDYLWRECEGAKVLQPSGKS